jgi:four helix bundle protein
MYQAMIMRFQILDFRLQIQIDRLCRPVHIRCGIAHALQDAVNPKQEALKARTKRFALDVLDFVETLPHQGPAVRIGWQLVDAATSVGANDRAACRARSDAEFAAKIGQVLEESDESLFWLELCDARRIGLGPLCAGCWVKRMSSPRSSWPRRSPPGSDWTAPGIAKSEIVKSEI